MDPDRKKSRPNMEIKFFGITFRWYSWKKMFEYIKFNKIAYLELILKTHYRSRKM